MVRCQQAGYDIKSIITDELIFHMYDIKNALSLILFMGKWIFPVDNFRNNRDMCDVIYTHLTLENISKKLGDKLDLFKIYQKYRDCPNDLPEKYKSLILSCLELPKNSIIESGLSCIDKEVTLDTTQCFTFDTVTYENLNDLYDASYVAYRLPQNASGYRISDILEKYAKYQIGEDFFLELSDLMVPLLETFETRIELLKKMRDRSVIPKIHIDLPVFPLIIISTDESIMISLKYEYRTKRPLKLGVDVITLATDTIENKKILSDYIDKHKLNCNVILFSEL